MDQRTKFCLPSVFANEKKWFTPATYFLAKKLRSKINMYFQMYFSAVFVKPKSGEMVKIFSSLKVRQNPRDKKISAACHSQSSDTWGRLCLPADTLFITKRTFLTKLQRLDLCIPSKGTARPQYQFPHSCVCERFIYVFPWAVHLFSAAEYADRLWVYMYKSHTETWM
jgi:hypothetical protein